MLSLSPFKINGNQAPSSGRTSARELIGWQADVMNTRLWKH